jgi:hypothetical protein
VAVLLGEIDAKTNEYMRENAHFADLFNYYLYQGEQVIDPDNLRELDRTSASLIYGDESKKLDIDEDFRDILKLLTIKEDDKATYLLLGLEDQMHVHYAMPVRNMLYDAKSYAMQVKNSASKHRQHHESGESSDEFLSGFHKDDKLQPVITLVLYWSGKEWDGPVSVHEMLDTNDQKLLKFIPDYRINLVSPVGIYETDFEKFQTPLAEVLQYIKYSGNKEALDRVLEENEKFHHLDRESADLLNTVTNSNLEFEEGKEEVDVCTAVKEMREESKLEGRQEGINESRIQFAKNLLKDGSMTTDKIAKMAMLPLSKVKELEKEMFPLT